ncbi:MAG: hypothetical protein GKS00_03100 [Alphaproteobacteria bacterium]|nr:hypothetical protein [Alphaproteobacteria bacterium]
MTEDKNDGAETSEPPEETTAADSALDDAERVVAAFGGIRPMAARLGVAATTIQGWKSRGNIPQNRRQMVSEAIAADGIDLSAPVAAPDDAVEAATDDAPSVAAPPPPARQSNGVAWLALTVAGLAGVAVATQPEWAPLVFGETPVASQNTLEPRIIALERRPAAPDVSRRVATLEQALAELRARAPIAAAPDLTPQVSGLSSRLDDLSRALETARTEGRSATDIRAADVAALREAFDALTAKVEQAALDTAAANVQGSALILAVGALEIALSDGLPYGGALDAVAGLAPADDTALAEQIAVLEPGAAAGIPTRGQLMHRLSELAESRGTPVWSAETESWTDKVLQKIDKVIVVRRIDEAADGGAQSRRVKRAAATGSLSDAIAALDGATAPAAAWVRDARHRIAADRAFAALRLRAIERLRPPAGTSAR